MSLEQHLIWDQQKFVGRMRGKTDRVVKLVNMFLGDMPERMSELNEDVLAEHYEACIATAHNVKGVSANLSILRLQHVAAEVEKAAKSEQADELKSLLSEINKVYQESEVELKRFVETNS